MIPGGNTPPTAPAAQQYKSDLSLLAMGGTVTDGIVYFRATVTDPDNDTVKLQVEVRPVGTAFTGAMTHESALVSSGSTASVQASGLSGDYRWQARTVDALGGASAWVPFGGTPDFTAGASGGGGGGGGSNTREGENGDNSCNGSVPGRRMWLIALLGVLFMSLIRRRA